ncbi:hypothetical protein KY290_027832 [Solanum tuberosum]|uniref:Ubiquitin-like protease family profile domain-containing protein n=1 Tax=Solanum tuberosum TaxID=4113 RepID=A0ABQ7UJE7_SOLTU|nr:hypothetical protein KY284_026832 [Solanum tuberosum]KAH0748600.1 hypothetical protein KY290_027832 [Solanum tuberosum]
MDLNFYTNFKKRDDSISEEATTTGARPYPEAWIGLGKSIIAVMNMNNTQFVTLEILLHEGRMNVYDCNLMSMEHEKIFTFIQHVSIGSHGKKNNTNFACGAYSISFIEHLITGTPIQPPNTDLYDNTIGQMQWIWAAGIVSRNLEP